MTETIFEGASNCFACGPDNPIGLKISFNLDDENNCIGYFQANNNHVGYEDTVHGGIIFTALDDVMANVLYLNKIKALTAKCEVRYRNSLHVGQKIKLTGWIVSQKKRLITLKADAKLNSDNKIIAECDARFMFV